MGAFYDEPGSEKILSHAHLFTSMQEYLLKGFYDIDLEMTERAAKKWNAEAFADLETALEGTDIAVVAVPDRFHMEYMRKLAGYDLKLILLEKPVATCLAEAQEMNSIFEKKKVPVAVNYSRQYVPEFNHIAAEIKDNLYGGFVAGSGYYGKGLLHSGSHMIAMLLVLLGRPLEVCKQSEIVDYTADDPSISALLKFSGGGEFYLHHVSAEKYTVFEMDLLFERKRIRITELGGRILVSSPEEDPVFPGYKTLRGETESETGLYRSLEHLGENLIDFLSGRGELNCTLEWIF